jgi:hypothetical protein
MAFFYLSKEWRMGNAPHTDASVWPKGFKCDFEATWGYGLNPNLATRNQDFQQFAVNYYKEAVLDMHCTVKKRVLEPKA